MAGLIMNLLMLPPNLAGAASPISFFSPLSPSLPQCKCTIFRHRNGKSLSAICQSLIRTLSLSRFLSIIQPNYNPTNEIVLRPSSSTGPTPNLSRTTFRHSQRTKQNTSRCFESRKASLRSTGLANPMQRQRNRFANIPFPLACKEQNSSTIRHERNTVALQLEGNALLDSSAVYAKANCTLQVAR